jgi:hypothetical protein
MNTPFSIEAMIAAKLSFPGSRLRLAMRSMGARYQS